MAMAANMQQYPQGLAPLYAADGRLLGYQHTMMDMRAMMPQPAGKLGHGVSDPGVYEHKLFVGQVPFELTEHDLWGLFSQYGFILELAVLRSGGLSKGCAFLTYATKAQANNALRNLHGMQIAPGKRLVLKFAEHKIAATAKEASTGQEIGSSGASSS